MSSRNELTFYYTGDSSSEGNRPYYRKQLVSDGGNTPLSLRSKGILSENNYELSVDTTKNEALVISNYPDMSNPWPGSVKTMGGVVIFSPVPDPVLASVIPNLLQKWRQSSFNAGVTAGEGKQTVNMIAQRVMTVRYAFRSLKKGDFGGTLRHFGQRVPGGAKRRAKKKLDAGDVPGAWLELRMGWLPLLSDIYSAAEFVKIPSFKNVIRSHSTEKDPSGSAASSLIPDSFVTIKKNEKTLYLKVTVSKPAELYERLGLTDPATIVWELTPFSFVVDWVLPIQNTLESLHAIRAMPVTACCETMVYRYNGECQLNEAGPYGSAWCYPGPKYSNQGVIMSRKGTASLPSAWDVVSQVPKSIQNPMDGSLTRLGDAVSLLAKTFVLKKT